MSIYPLVNPDDYGPKYDHKDSSSNNLKATAFRELEQFLVLKYYSLINQYKLIIIVFPGKAPRLCEPRVQTNLLLCRLLDMFSLLIPQK
jgi:hypothetical protein